MEQLVSVIMISIVLGYFNQKSLGKGEKLSEKNFVARTPHDFFWLGAIVIIMATAIGYAGYITGEFNTLASVAMTLLGLLIGGPLVIAPIKGVWQVEFKGDDVTATKFFVFKKHFLFSNIEKAIQTNGGLKVYVKDRKRTAFFMDRMWYGTGTFIKRMDKNNIPITRSAHLQRMIDKRKD